MLFEVMTRTIKNSNNLARKLKAVLSVQSFYLKITNNKKKLYFEENIPVNEKNPK